MASNGNSEPTPIDFVINQLNDEVTLDISAGLDQFKVDLSSANCTVFYEVSLNQLREVFKFQTDSSDVDPDGSDNDVTYHIDHTQFPNVNVANASYVEGNFGETGVKTGNPVATGFGEKRSLLKHDFIRHLADQLFNTYHGVDLFNNEQELKDELVRLGSVILTNIHEDLSGANLEKNNNKEDSNIGYKLMKQIGYHDPDRFRTDVSHGIQDTNDVQSIPLIDDDKLIFNVKINPAEGQNNLTGVDSVSSRTYRIVLILKDSVTNNTEPDDIFFSNLQGVTDWDGNAITSVEQTYVVNE